MKHMLINDFALVCVVEKCDMHDLFERDMFHYEVLRGLQDRVNRE